jgi:phosphoribosylamine--glycine ligase
MGDPETEVVMLRIKTDFNELLEGIAFGNLSEKHLVFDEKFAVTVMLVSGGYPGNYEKGKLITGLDKVTESIAFHAGTCMGEENEIFTNGGRVIAVSSYGKNKDDALKKSYSNAKIIAYEGKYFRSDIGFDL